MLQEKKTKQNTKPWPELLACSLKPLGRGQILSPQGIHCNRGKSSRWKPILLRRDRKPSRVQMIRSLLPPWEENRKLSLAQEQSEIHGRVWLPQGGGARRPRKLKCPNQGTHRTQLRLRLNQDNNNNKKKPFPYHQPAIQSERRWTTSNSSLLASGNKSMKTDTLGAAQGRPKPEDEVGTLRKTLTWNTKVKLEETEATSALKVTMTTIRPKTSLVN